MNPNDIIIGERLRPLNAERVAELERSIAAIGLQTPITIRHTEGKPILIAGGHRLQAVKNLGWTEIPVREFDGDDRAARMWEIAENLHRAELTVLERSEQLAEWIRLSEEVSAQIATKPQGGHPKAASDKRHASWASIRMRPIVPSRSTAWRPKRSPRRSNSGLTIISRLCCKPPGQRRPRSRSRR